MATQHISFRIETETLARLEARSRLAGQSRSHLAQTLLEEGLRMEEHPGIVFRAGPAGRRAGLASGPDVWEIVRVFTQVQRSSTDAVTETARLTGLTEDRVHIAIGYYADYQDEIDEWIREVDAEADRAEAAWRRRQALLES